MRNASRSETAGRLPASDGNFSRAARRDVRRKVRLATELGLYSVTAHGEVWTLRLSNSPTPTRDPASGLHAAGEAGDARNGALSGRKQRSLDRAAKHRALCAKADALRVRHLLKWWSKDSGDGPPPLPPPPGLPPSPPPPMATTLQPPPPPPPQQQQEAKDDARASKRDAPPSPAVGDSPAAPRAKRALPLTSPRQTQASTGKLPPTPRAPGVQVAANRGADQPGTDTTCWQCGCSEAAAVSAVKHHYGINEARTRPWFFVRHEGGIRWHCYPCLRVLNGLEASSSRTEAQREAG